MMTKRGSAHVAKRLTQTPVLFRNFPVVLADLALHGSRFQRAEMTFRLRNGQTVVTPNADGARFPLYEIFADDAYGLKTFCEGIDPEARVLDVGGQIGAFSLAVSQLLPRAHIHVYEASPTSASYVQRNVDANDLGDRVTVHAEALAGQSGTFTFMDSGSASGHNGLTAPDGLGQEITVSATAFDDAVARAGGSLQLVKMDVEGAEYEIILRSDPASWSEVRKVVMEYHPVEGYHLKDLTDFFARIGLSPVQHDVGTREGLGIMWLIRHEG